MKSTIIAVGNDDVLVKSSDATKPFSLHPMDIEFIEQEILEDNCVNGELQVIVDEGLINTEWEIVTNKSNN